MHGIIDINKLKQLIEEIDNVHDKYSLSLGRSNTTRIKADKIDVYKSIIVHLKTNGLLGHTFTPKSELPFRVVIKGIHPSIPTSEIEEEITAAGHTTHGKIVAARHRISRNEMHVHFVSSKKAPNNSEIYNLKYVSKCIIKVEPPKKDSKPILCQCCQAIGHSKSNCFNNPICVKCSGEHLTTECPKPKKMGRDELVCALCNEKGHPANYRGCRIYKEVVAKRKPTAPYKFKGQPKENNAAQKITVHNDEDEVTYASVAAGSSLNTADNQITNTHPDTLTRIETIIASQHANIQLILTQLGTLLQLTTKLVTKLDK